MGYSGFGSKNPGSVFGKPGSIKLENTGQSKPPIGGDKEISVDCPESPPTESKDRSAGLDYGSFGKPKTDNQQAHPSVFAPQKPSAFGTGFTMGGPKPQEKQSAFGGYSMGSTQTQEKPASTFGNFTMPGVSQATKEEEE